jgi:hypothetical protein
MSKIRTMSKHKAEAFVLVADGSGVVETLRSREKRMTGDWEAGGKLLVANIQPKAGKEAVLNG